jgi:hypothetical protein
MRRLERLARLLQLFENSSVNFRVIFSEQQQLMVQQTSTATTSKKEEPLKVAKEYVKSY